MHTTGGYLTQVAFTHKYVFDLHPETDVYWCTADVGWVTGHSYIVYGPLANGGDVRDLRGRAQPPRQRPVLVDRREVRRDDPLHRADRDPHVHEVGRRRARPSTTCRRCACSARSASRSTPRRGCGTASTIGGGRCPVVDTWWQTETGGIMISPLPGRDHAQAGIGDVPAAGHRRRARRRRRQPRRARRRLPHAHPAVAGDAARHLGRPRALPRHVLEPLPRPVLRR